jgi:DNA-directed RNA polymerase subunit RPC12/RpoP
MALWENLVTLSPKLYRCGHCSEKVSSEKGYYAKNEEGYIFVCPNCSRPTYFSGEKQYPGSLFGEKVKDVPKDIEALYDEARQCFSVFSFTASVMACRKLIMHIAVQKGEKPNLSFKEYVEFLDAQHFIPPDGKTWVDHIRDKSNEANHEIKIMKKEDAEDLIIFIEMLLKFIYEFPSRIKAKQKPTP